MEVTRVVYTPMSKWQHENWMEGWLNKACELERQAAKAKSNEQYMEYMKAAWGAFDEARRHEKKIAEM